jgi:hypothetical protein
MSYARVLPRDLFNEAKLLKCLGRLTLLIHDADGATPLRFEHVDEESGFIIEQDESSGDLFCRNLGFFVGDYELSLFSKYNSKEAYPLYFMEVDDSGFIFDDDGEFSIEFKALVRHITETEDDSDVWVYPPASSPHGRSGS